MENLNIAEILSKTGLSLPQALEGIQKAVSFIPTVKGFIPKIKDYEKSFNLKPNQRVLYCAQPLVPTFTGNESEQEIKDMNALCDIRIMALVIEEENGQTKIVDQKFELKAFEQIEKITSLIPSM